MYQLIRQWINTKFTALAAITSVDFDEVDTTIDMTKLPANAKYLNYLVKIPKIYPLETAQTEDWKVADVTIELCFGIYNKEKTGYQTAFDTYLNPLYKYFKAQNMEYSDNTISTTLKLSQVREAQIEDGDKLDNGGKYLTPKITMKILAYDPV